MAVQRKRHEHLPMTDFQFNQLMRELRWIQILLYAVGVLGVVQYFR